MTDNELTDLAIENGAFDEDMRACAVRTAKAALAFLERKLQDPVQVYASILKGEIANPDTQK